MAINELFSDLPKVEHVYFTDDWIIKSRKTDEVRYTAKSIEDARRWCFEHGAWLIKKVGEQYKSLIEVAKDDN